MPHKIDFVVNTRVTSLNIIHFTSYLVLKEYITFHISITKVSQMYSGFPRADKILDGEKRRLDVVK